MTRTGTIIRVLSSEGISAVLNRVLDGLAERRRLKTFEPVFDAELPREKDFVRPPVINISIVPPHPNRGGSQLQMLDRLREEQAHRTVALLYPRAGNWRLEIQAAERKWIVDGPKSDPSNKSLAKAVSWARNATGTTAIHLENLALVPLEQIPSLADDGPLIVAVHDFTAYCRRPHLMEQPASTFCNYSTDLERCRRCLAHDWDLPPDAATTHRRLAHQAMSAADHIIFPSEFLREQYSRLFPDLSFDQCSTVIEPATENPILATNDRPHPPHIAFVGGIKGHKGGALVIETASLLRRDLPNIRLTAFGDGDPTLLLELKKQARVRIHGYYRRGHLPQLLVRDQVDIAIMPSIWPEAYGLVVDECLRAGIPVVAFDLGAIGPRLRRLSVGKSVTFSLGSAGLAAAALELLDRENPKLNETLWEELPTPKKVSEKYLKLYWNVLSQAPVVPDSNPSKNSDGSPSSSAPISGAPSRS